MKLYSRRQVLFYSIASAFLVLLLLLGFGIIGNSSKKNVVSVKSLETSLGNPTSLQPSDVNGGNMYPVDSAPSGNYSVEELNNIKIYEALNRGVVNITTETIRYNWFLEPVPSDGGTGSGSIIDIKGYVLTNYHVVKNAYKLYINLYDGSQFVGKVIGKDKENDLAIVKFDPRGKKLITIPFGESENLKVGQKVLAIGNPFGYDRTLTTGIVSGLGRPVRTSGSLVIQGMIQTDASINPGNSGGPLINSRGKMIGINTMIYSPSGGSVGIGFAIPVKTARRVVPDLIAYGHVNRGWIDFYPVQLDQNIVRYGKLSVNKGILVSKVEKNSNAAKAGIRGGDINNPVQYGKSIIYFGGDIITQVDGVPTATLSDLFSALEDNKPGDIVEVHLLRGKRKLTVTVKLSKRPDNLLL